MVEPYVIAALLHRTAGAWLVQSGMTESADDIRRKLANNGVFHIARIAAYLWRGSDSWHVPTDELKVQIGMLENDPASLSPVFTKALDGLSAIMIGAARYKSDLDAALKSATLDSDVDKALHQKKI